MTTNTLNNFSLYLWDNGSEGLHVTVTTNYNLPNEKRSFLSFGKQTYKSWYAYNQYQPAPLKEFFAEFKTQHQKKIKTYAAQYWISKLVTNTKKAGRKTARGAMILLEDNQEYGFILQLAELEFRGVFDAAGLTAKQLKGAKGVCLGSFIWKEDSGDIQEYAEAF